MKKVSNFFSSCFDGIKPFCLFPEYFGSSLQTTEKQVDLKRYMGLWYEIARMPQGFQKDCVMATAEYTMDGDSDKINVLNTCITKSGEIIKGKASAYSCSDNNSKLKVNFSQFFSWPYWILDVADDYSWAVIGGPCVDTAWILARGEEMEAGSLDKRIRFLEEKGYDTSRLVFRGEEQE